MEDAAANSSLDPVTVTWRDLLPTGGFACPNCIEERRGTQRLHREQRTCGTCGVRLIWRLS